MTETEIHVSQILPGTAYQLIGTNSGATKDVYLTLAGTTNQISVGTVGTTITLSTPQNINSGASPTFASETLTNTTNQLVLGTTRTVTVSATQPATSSRTYTIPDQGAAANFVLDQSNYTIAGTWTFTPNTTFTGGLTSTGTITATNQNLVIKNISITTVASDPGSPVEGQLWYNSTTHQFIGYNGTSNVIIG